MNPGPFRLNGPESRIEYRLFERSSGWAVETGAASFGQSVTTFVTRTFGN